MGDSSGTRIGGGTLTNDRGDKVGKFDIVRKNGGEHIIYRDNHGKALRGKNRQRAEEMKKVYEKNSRDNGTLATRLRGFGSGRNNGSLNNKAAEYRRAKAEGRGATYQGAYSRGLDYKYANNKGGGRVTSQSYGDAIDRMIASGIKRERAVKIAQKQFEKDARDNGNLRWLMQSERSIRYRRIPGILPSTNRTYGGNANSRWDRVNRTRQAR